VIGGDFKPWNLAGATNLARAVSGVAPGAKPVLNCDTGPSSEGAAECSKSLHRSYEYLGDPVDPTMATVLNKRAEVL
jgi:hypothetical protein